MDHPALSVPRGCTNFKLRQLTRLVTRHYEAFFAESGLRITQYSLLSHVVRLDAVPCSELAAAMQLSPSTLTRALDPLVQQGLLQLAPGADARQRYVQATAAGRLRHEAAQRTWKQAQLALNERLGAARVAALHQLIDEGIEALAADAALPGEEA
jgi:DNA-binding MarR family transcriptional regulator